MKAITLQGTKTQSFDLFDVGNCRFETGAVVSATLCVEDRLGEIVRCTRGCVVSRYSPNRS